MYNALTRVGPMDYIQNVDVADNEREKMGERGVEYRWQVEGHE